MKLTQEIYLVASGSAGIGLTNSYDCNVYLIDCGDGYVLIDCGAGLQPEKIRAQIEKHGFGAKQCKGILLTHAHADHSGGAKWMKQATGKTPLALEESARYLREGDVRAIALEKAMKAGVYPADYCFESCEADVIQDGQKLVFGNITLQAVKSEGHCSGHCCYWGEIGGEKVLFSGDAIFPGGKISLQPIWDCSVDEYAKTIEKLAALEVDALLPSHHGLLLQGGSAPIQAAHKVFAKLAVPPNGG